MIQDILIGVLVAGAVAYLILRLVRKKKKKHKENCNC